MADASINTMVKKCSGLLGTRDITPWEERFLQNVVQLTGNGDNTTPLSENQVGRLEEIYAKHFA
jgi:hypothetical protein